MHRAATKLIKGILCTVWQNFPILSSMDTWESTASYFVVSPEMDDYFEEMEMLYGAVDSRQGVM